MICSRTENHVLGSKLILFGHHYTLGEDVLVDGRAILSWHQHFDSIRYDFRSNRQEYAKDEE